MEERTYTVVNENWSDVVLGDITASKYCAIAKSNIT